ncbi:MAG: PAS domain S-box protein [Candidatus Thermoplasmatota archaeon]
MNLKAKIVCGYFLIILVAAFCSAVAIKKYAEVTTLYEEVSSKYYQTVKIAQELTYRILDRQAGLRGFLLTGKTRYLVPYDENILPSKSLIRRARELQKGDARYLAMIDQYDIIVKKWEETIAEAEKEMRQKLDYGVIDFPAYVTSISNIDKKGRPILRALHSVENQLVHRAEKDMSIKSTQALNAAKYAKRLLITITLGSLILTAVFGFFLSNHITTPLKQFAQGAETISRGDLSKRIHFSRRDELGILAEAFNHMTERLQNSINTLKESEEKYATLVEKANDGIVIIQDMKYLFVNRKFSDITGYSSEELIGNDFFIILSPDILDAIKRRHNDRMAGKEVPAIYETKIVTKSGETKYVEVNAGLIEYKDRKTDLVVFRDITARKHYQRDLRELSEKIILTQEEERKRISRELHDEIGQALTALSIQLDVLGSICLEADVKSKITDLKDLTEKSIDNIHRISYDLRPYMLDEFGLISALRWLTDTCHERTRIDISIHILGREYKLPQTIDTLIYRFVQEALTNVSKHGNAQNVDISIDYQQDIVGLSVRDDGQGFDPDEILRGQRRMGGLGLFGMRERLALFGGELSIESVPGKGSTLYARISTNGVAVKGVS